MPVGELALVLHTHLPYVESGWEWPHPRNPPNGPGWEGFGTWPFGEEWLWEAIATSYVPLLDVLAAPGGERVTLSVTPVLADQLEVGGALERCVRFLEEIRPESHRLDIEELTAAGHEELGAELSRSAAQYAGAARRLRELSAGGGLLAALAPYASWTSSATHAILPLLATDAGALMQVQTGVGSHRRRFGGWDGGFWLPECAHAPWLDELLEDAGVRATCVELTGVYGLGDPRHLRPLVATGGPVLWLLDRATVALVWGSDGYPSRAPYRDSHRHTTHRHHVWRNDGAPYDHAAALAQARADGAEFVSRVGRRVSGGGVCVCALDTELLGHWWYEGVDWLAAVLEESARQGLALTRLDDALARHQPAPAPVKQTVSSWGDGGDLRTWSGPQVAELAWAARAAELRLAAVDGQPPERALRELLALQSSDWAFLHTHATAGGYPRQRADAHRAALYRALAGDAALADPALRGLAPDLAGWA
ncbi:MAG: 1,4-alpha-glucan branching protein domain-containing protein [Solirubrobacteraceae bacterium]